MWDVRKVSWQLNLFHVSDIFDEFTVVLVPVVFEENEDQMLMLGVDLFSNICRDRA